MTLHKADFHTPVASDTKAVRCNLCSHNCLIADGRRGRCKIRQNFDGILYSLVYGKLINSNVDPIEKKPLFHLLPGSLSYSIATVGCNFRCQHCQNYQISQYPVLNQGQIPGQETTPQEVVSQALASGCKSISYTYIEPTVFFEFAYDTAVAAHQAGIKNVFVSNGYTSRTATDTLAPYLDANNIDLKAFTDKFYKEVCNARLAPVLDSIQHMKERGVWVEVTTLIIPGWNDSDQELQQIAQFLVSVDPEMPWHVSRFHPTYKMRDKPATPTETLHRAREIGAAAGLQYIYTGNIPGQGGENTICPHCAHTVIERVGYTIRSMHLQEGKCMTCGTPLPGIW